MRDVEISDIKPTTIYLTMFLQIQQPLETLYPLRKDFLKHIFSKNCFEMYRSE